MIFCKRNFIKTFQMSYPYLLFLYKRDDKRYLKPQADLSFKSSLQNLHFNLQKSQVKKP